MVLDGCTDSCETTTTYSYYEPVYVPLSELRASVDVGAPEEIKAVGKIYIKGPWLFINQPGEGIHIIDNSNPSAPLPKNFIKIPGSWELAVKGNTLYTDSYMDLVMFDISDMNNIREASRLENVFSNYNTLGFYVDAERGLVTDFVLQENVQITRNECEAQVQPWGGIYYEDGIAFRAGTAFNLSAAITPGIGSGPGVGGSMARFTIADNHLYALDYAFIRTFDVTSERNPADRGSTQVSWDMETIFPYGKNLFIGSRGGMHIVDISNPATPLWKSTYEHVRVCDPVVVQDTLAYVTLRSGTECEGFTNQLEVINVKDLQNPSLIKAYPMHNPHGLGIDDKTLFVADGDAGLKVFDVADLLNIDKNMIGHRADIHGYDVIPFNNLLIMIGEDGLFQFDYTNPSELKFLSKLNIVHED